MRDANEPEEDESTTFDGSTGAAEEPAGRSGRGSEGG